MCFVAALTDMMDHSFPPLQQLLSPLVGASMQCTSETAEKWTYSHFDATINTCAMQLPRKDWKLATYQENMLLQTRLPPQCI